MLTLAAEPSRGYCNAFVTGPGNCVTGSTGTWNISAAQYEHGVQLCGEACSKCSNCRFYSFGHAQRQCSWFHDCDLNSLRSDAPGFVTFAKKPSADPVSYLRNDALPTIPIFLTKRLFGSLKSRKSSELPACFSPNMQSAQLEGEWVFRADARPPYDISRSHWPEMWGKGLHYYGVCKEANLGPAQGSYVWQPKGCRLRSFRDSADGACKLLQGRRIVLAGDSTVLQFFQSLTLVLGGKFTAWAADGGKPLDKESREDPRRIVSFACGGATRIDFFRNDYLQYTRQDERTTAQDTAFNPSRAFLDFTTSAHHADIVVLGTGIHYQNDRQNSPSLFSRMLNHTVASLQSARRTLKHAPLTTFLLSPPKPNTECRKYSKPISLSESVESDWTSGPHSGQYKGLRRYHQIAAWTAATHQANFIDSFSLGARRPDAAIAHVADAYDRDPNGTLRVLFPESPRPLTARQVKKAATGNDDCVHFCLPGPPDTFVRVFLGMLLDTDDVQQLFARPSARSWSAVEEGLAQERTQSLSIKIPALASLWWWPKATTRGGGRGGRRGKNRGAGSEASVDRNPNCEQYAREGVCTKSDYHRRWSKRWCYKSCADLQETHNSLTDRSPNCTQYANQGVCVQSDYHLRWTKQWCSQACHSEHTAYAALQDKNPECSKYLATGVCTQSAYHLDWSRKWCARTCFYAINTYLRDPKHRVAPPTVALLMSPPPPPLVDKNPNCVEYMRQGVCTKSEYHISWSRMWCAYSCTDVITAYIAMNSTRELPSNRPVAAVKKFHIVLPPSPPPPPPMPAKDKNDACERYVRIGVCTQSDFHRSWAQKWCAKSCEKAWQAEAKGDSLRDARWGSTSSGRRRQSRRSTTGSTSDELGSPDATTAEEEGGGSYDSRRGKRSDGSYGARRGGRSEESSFYPRRGSRRRERDGDHEGDNEEEP